MFNFSVTACKQGCTINVGSECRINNLFSDICGDVPQPGGLGGGFGEAHETAGVAAGAFGHGEMADTDAAVERRQSACVAAEKVHAAPVGVSMICSSVAWRLRHSSSGTTNSNVDGVIFCGVLCIQA